MLRIKRSQIWNSNETINTAVVECISSCNGDCITVFNIVRWKTCMPSGQSVLNIRSTAYMNIYIYFVVIIDPCEHDIILKINEGGFSYWLHTTSNRPWHEEGRLKHIALYQFSKERYLCWYADQNLILVDVVSLKIVHIQLQNSDIANIPVHAINTVSSLF